MKIMITIPDGLLEKLDYHSEQQFKSRSGFIQDLINDYCQQHDYIEAIKELKVFCSKNSKVAKYNDSIVEQFRSLMNNLGI